MTSPDEITEMFASVDPSMFEMNEEEGTEDLRRYAKSAVACLLFRLIQNGMLDGEECGVMLFAVTGGKSRAEVAAHWEEFIRVMIGYIHGPEPTGVSHDVLLQKLNDDIYRALNG